jgi:hypothetical protein
MQHHKDLYLSKSLCLFFVANITTCEPSAFKALGFQVPQSFPPVSSEKKNLIIHNTVMAGYISPCFILAGRVAAPPKMLLPRSAFLF